ASRSEDRGGARRPAARARRWHLRARLRRAVARRRPDMRFLRSRGHTRGGSEGGGLARSGPPRRTLGTPASAGGPGFRLVVFGLDGTLMDGYAGTAGAVAYSLEKLRLPPVPFERVRRMVGHGLETLVARAAGEERAAEGVRLFRRRYPEVAVAKTDLMAGVPETLAALDARGIAL